MDTSCLSAQVVVGSDGRIVAVGSSEAVAAAVGADAQFETDIDATGMSVVPGLVDGHTHPVWAGNRVNEFAMKLAGATYLDIHKAGGGIGYTVEFTQKASEEDLVASLLDRVRAMSQLGTTLAEAKSGYGRETATELKMLRAIHRAAQDQTAVDLVSTFLGAHSVPKGSTAAAAAKDVVDVQLPAVMQAKADGTISPELIDVFYEKGVFEEEEMRAIGEAGTKAGLLINFHGDELAPMEAGVMGADLGALAISHLEELSERGIKAMADAEVIGVLLPTTAHLLRLKLPPARAMIEAGVPVALGSDFNPNAHCMSMPFVMNLACVTMRLTMEEALAAATINAAASMNRERTHGSLEVGKFGDMVVLSTPDWRHLVYEMVNPPLAMVIKSGTVVHKTA